VWANNVHTVNVLKQPASATGQAANSEAFNKFYAMNDMSEVKAKYKDWEKRLQRFIECMECPVQALEREVSRFNRMHAANAQP
jgi:hypothetical protein